MHSLLKRQIRKYLPEEIDANQLSDLMKAIDMSYRDYDEKLAMIQRATTISSKELFDANRELEKEAQRQKKIIDSLENALSKLEENIDDDFSFSTVSKDKGLNIEALASRITNLALQVTEMSIEKDKLLKSLEARNTDLNNYAHMVSHDLKSPLRNISALMDWILEEEKEKLSSESQRNALLLVQNLEKMDSIITGVLRHASIGTTHEQPVIFNIENLIEEILQTIYVPDNISIDLEKARGQITFEKRRLEQIFTNLLTNAIRATEGKKNGLIKIDFSEKEEFFEFTFHDNGKGIAKEHQEKIFDMFKKLDNDPSSTGIGLTLVKKLVQHYDGEIILQSEVNKGTIFKFTLKKYSNERKS